MGTDIDHVIAVTQEREKQREIRALMGSELTHTLSDQVAGEAFKRAPWGAYDLGLDTTVFPIERLPPGLGSLFVTSTLVPSARQPADKRRWCVPIHRQQRTLGRVPPQLPEPGRNQSEWSVGERR
jgi:hypothetical protein